MYSVILPFGGVGFSHFIMMVELFFAINSFTTGGSGTKITLKNRPPMSV